LTARNLSLKISGVLLYDGEYFLQVLEGDSKVVDPLYESVCRDERHSGIVLLLRDPIPFSHFNDFKVDILDVRDVQGLTASEAWAQRGTALGLTSNRDHRSARILEAFVRGRWRDSVPAVAWSADNDALVSSGHEQATAGRTHPPASPVVAGNTRFALQPIVHAKSHRITSVEALLRGPNGESPQAVLGTLPADRLHAFDLQSKADAIALVAALKLDCVLSVNLLPMSLLSKEGAVDFLVRQCHLHQWPLDKFLVEITEEEAITHLDEFLLAVQQLRTAGIQVAIDDFGAGHAGLSLLADFQPDKLKIDKRIIQGVHSSGPRQAIVRSVMEFCFCLGITVVAEGVEAVEDWAWLQTAGVRRFQGYLFARPGLEGLPPVAWPVVQGA
jgi:EAL domain-containing protein (putative c-di-GMP-specific phosphodiesterase class I)